jgi:TPR repeat protein
MRRLFARLFRERREPAPDPVRAADKAHNLRMACLLQMDDQALRATLAADPGDAAGWIESAARLGVMEAQVWLGQMRLDGMAGPRDEACALDWFLKAARQGSAEAMNMAGRCYENGWGAGRDLGAAAQWYRRAADLGLAWGEYNWANMLFDGLGVARDRSAAVAWYARAAAQGHARAMNLLARCHEEGWGVARDAAQALRWYRRAAEGGYFRAQFNYATALIAIGRGGEARRWLESARDGDADGKLRPLACGLLARLDATTPPAMESAA